MSRVTEDPTLCLTYLRYELRQRWWQALVTAAGLAVGVALVITVSAAASGTQAAQSRVLDSLNHAASSSTAASSSAAATAISGAVATTSGLAADLGIWVAAAALVASFTIATLLTLASVARRIREFGTLKALGWPARRITSQVLTETAVVGTAGTLAGVALGYAGTALVCVLGPTLIVNVTEMPGIGSSPGSLDHDGPVVAHFSAPVSPDVVGLAVALGVLGTLLAGALGAWRAARLSPAAALSRIG